MIDPQQDFMDLPDSALPVPGATKDMDTVASIVQKWGHEFEDIHVTMDTHQRLAIFHPMFIRDKKGNMPPVFTAISHDEVMNGTWKAFHPVHQDWLEEYTQKLEEQGKFSLFIWPYHCLFGSWGHNVYKPLWDTLQEWEVKNNARVNYVQKGHNPFTEHYSAVKAEVIRDDDETTNLNNKFLDMLSNPEVDIILSSGEALSHCWAFTLGDVADYFSKEDIKKLYLVEGTSSPVGGFEDAGVEAIKNMKAKGMQVIPAANIPDLF